MFSYWDESCEVVRRMSNARYICDYPMSHTCEKNTLKQQVQSLEAEIAELKAENAALQSRYQRTRKELRDCRNNVIRLKNKLLEKK